MLSLRDDDDDDSHLCIRCNATIIGLDNYVAHRKRRCEKQAKNDTKVEITNIEPLESSYNLGADVFFQSLELQSSVKKTSLSRLTPPTPMTKDNKNSLIVASTSRDIQRISPLENNLRGEDWIGGHSLRIGTHEDNQTKLINAVASISGAVKKEVLVPTSTYNIGVYNDYKADDETDESEETEDEDDDDAPTGGKWKPPSNYTGGKWRPYSPDHEEWGEEELTGGKWKPIMLGMHERDDDYDVPPPDYTKGKWIPGANEKTQIMQTTIQTKGSVQYWCGPCNRRLGSKAIYDKHLISNLHMKKVLPEQELEFAGHLEPIRNAHEKRATKPSHYVNDSIYSQVEKRKKTISETQTNIDIVKKKRKRKAIFVHCSGCKSRVRRHLMGKHLISHYHFRKVKDIQSDVYQQLILDNAHAIVHQSPFQCSPCKFYTNWLSNFMQHWFSDDHEKKILSMDGRLWCSFCKYECDTSQEMLQHMSGSDHSEVIAVINRSMPIIIRMKTIFRCSTCYREFRYNIEIKRHCQNTGHDIAYTATDQYQEFHTCQFCKVKFRSSLTLAAHLKSDHKQKANICLVCGITFNSSEEAKRHRQTSAHRIMRKERLRERGVEIKDMSKKCPYCTEKTVLKNVLELKDHIRRIHPDIKKKCPKCGMSFTLSQEVTRHVRANACQFQDSIPLSAAVMWNCSQCLFTTDSQAECFFHEVLHTSPNTEVYKVKDVEKVVQKYDCPLCPKSFRKDSLRQHLRQHTFERPFVCSTCGANFTRQTSLANHSKNDHGTQMPSKATKLPVIAKIEEESSGKVSCGKCKKDLANKASAARHATSCERSEQLRCPHDQCAFVATSAVQLARHRRVHGDRIKYHECRLCPYRSDQASHLKRHLLCHQGVKPYACPHCSFLCGSLENLRKHVLRSGRHQDASLYQCKEPACSFETNMATEFRNHLTNSHNDKYDSKAAMQAVKTHLMK